MAEFNWTSVEQSVPSKRSCYDYEQYQKYFRKVAFDCYKSAAGNSDQLWELRTADDGRQYLYALYGEPEDVVAASVTTWEATADQDGSQVTLSYKNIPVYKFAAKDYRFTPELSQEFAKFLTEKARDPKWIDTLLSKAMTEERKAAVLKLVKGEG